MIDRVTAARREVDRLTAAIGATRRLLREDDVRADAALSIELRGVLATETAAYDAAQAELKAALQERTDGTGAALRAYLRAELAR